MLHGKTAEKRTFYSEKKDKKTMLTVYARFIQIPSFLDCSEAVAWSIQLALFQPLIYLVQPT